MPHPPVWRREFGIELGTQLRSGSLVFTIEECHVGHVSKKAFERYELPMRLELKCSESGLSEKELREGAVDALQKQVDSVASKFEDKKTIIYSEYGSPYECDFGKIKVDEVDVENATVYLSSKGVAVRRRDLPTMKDLVEQKRAAGETHPDDDPANAPESFKAEHRILKSHFATSKCATCKEPVCAGDYIAKAFSHKGRGGWSHLRCAVKAAREAGKIEKREGEISEPEDEDEEKQQGAPGRKEGPEQQQQKPKRVTRSSSRGKDKGSRAAGAKGAKRKRSRGSKKDKEKGEEDEEEREQEEEESEPEESRDEEGSSEEEADSEGEGEESTTANPGKSARRRSSSRKPKSKAKRTARKKAKREAG